MKKIYLFCFGLLVVTLFAPNKLSAQSDPDTETLRIYSEPGDGRVINYCPYSNWATCRNAENGSRTDQLDLSWSVQSYRWYGSTYQILRSFYWFDLSKAADLEQAEEVSFNLYITESLDSSTYYLVRSNQSASTTLAVDDFSRYSQDIVGEISNVVPGQYNKIALDKTVLENNTAKFALIEAHDLNNIEPTNESNFAFVSYYSEAGEEYAPYLEIKYKEIQVCDDCEVLKIFAEPSDGYVMRNSFNSWSDVQDGEDGSYVRDYLLDSEARSSYYQPSGKFYNARAFLSFNTNILPDDIIIENATVNLYKKHLEVDINDGFDYIALVEGRQASVTSLSVDDFDACGDKVDKPTEGSYQKDMSSDIVEGYNAFNLNQIGAKWINLNGYTKIGVREGHDINDVSIGTGPSYWGNIFQWYSSEESGTSKDPYLEITYKPKEETVEPVVFLPGMMGSQRYGSDWLVDPIAHTYDGLIKAFDQSEAYGLGRNFFVLAYDWHQDNDYTAQLLKQKIADIKSALGVAQVDIVAHSMGGLVARAYIQSDGYAGDVDQFITLNTPHKGAPEAYLSYEAAKHKGWLDCIRNFIFRIDAAQHGYLDLVEYVQAGVPSLAQLLPDYSYLHEHEADDALRAYPDEYPRNEWLEGLNAGADRLGERVDMTVYYSFFPKYDRLDSTLTGFAVTPPRPEERKWPHGKVKEELWGIGDGTVPEASLLGLGAEFTHFKAATVDHSAINAAAQQDLIEELSGQRPEAYYSNFDSAIDRLLFVRVYSPVDFQIIDPEGRRLGKDFDAGAPVNEIAGAFYSHFDNPAEFATIPNPIPGRYQVLVQGVDAGGDYGLGVNMLDKGESEEADNIFYGRIEPGERLGFELEITADQSQEPAIRPDYDDPLQKFRYQVNYHYEQGGLSKASIKKFLLKKADYWEWLGGQIDAQKGWPRRIAQGLFKLSLRITERQMERFERRGWMSREALEGLVGIMDAVQE